MYNAYLCILYTYVCVCVYIHMRVELCMAVCLTIHLQKVIGRCLGKKTKKGTSCNQDLDCDYSGCSAGHCDFDLAICYYLPVCGCVSLWLCGCLCACACARARMCVCVRVCVCSYLTRERKRNREVGTCSHTQLRVEHTKKSTYCMLAFMVTLSLWSQSSLFCCRSIGLLRSWHLLAFWARDIYRHCEFVPLMSFWICDI